MQGAQRGHALEQRLELLFDSIHLLVCQLLQCCRLSVKSCIGFDLGQRQPEVLQGQNAIQVFHVVVGVQALVLRALRRRRQQALLVVILDGAHRHADASRQLADSQVVLFGHGCSSEATEARPPPFLSPCRASPARSNCNRAYAMT